MGLVTPLGFLAVLLLVQPWLLLAAVAAGTHSWLKPSSAPVVSLQGTLPSQVQDVAFIFVEFQKTPAGPFFQPAQLPLDGETCPSVY